MRCTAPDRMVYSQMGIEENRAIRNGFALKLCCILTLVFYAGFWVLDWFVVPEYVRVTFFMRLSTLLFAIFILRAFHLQKRWVMRYHFPLALVLGLSMCWGIAVMSWLHRGLESPYYAGINMVALVISMSMSWNLRQTLIFNSLVFGFYISPLLFGVPIHDLPTFLSNQFFFVSLLILPAISQRHRVRLETHEFEQRATLKSYLAQVRELATKDSLTRLNNRRHFLTLGLRELARCHRYRRAFSVIMVDIDWFKKINDSHGHKAGDDVIQTVANRLQSSVRAIDIVGRYGGEEFVICSPECNSKDAMNLIVARIQRAIGETPIQTSAGALPVTVSIGIFGMDSAPQGLESMIDSADKGLYLAKEGGRNRAVEWTPQKTSKRAA